MAGPPRQTRITGIVHIARVARPNDRMRPFNYLISFGGSTNQVGAVNLGKALGIENLIGQLRKIGVSLDDAEAAAHALISHEQHEIPDITFTHGQLLRWNK